MREQSRKSPLKKIISKSPSVFDKYHPLIYLLLFGSEINGYSISHMRKSKVFVTGCFDMLHSGHVHFLEEASKYGDLYVGIGSDQTIEVLKGGGPLYTQMERKYLIESLKFVKRCFINQGHGVIDFAKELKIVSPNIFIVNEDGHNSEKSNLCKELGIKYLILKRRPKDNLPLRSTTSLRKKCRIPYRIDLAGGWLDQPSISQFAQGPVITLSIEPIIEFNERSGMATSTRRRAIELWQMDIPFGNKEKLAKTLFCFENPPGTQRFSGSQDAIGLIYPGLNRLDYAGDYWPIKISSVLDQSILDWLESHICLVTLRPREKEFEVFANSRVLRTHVEALAKAAEKCWTAILHKDLAEFGYQLKMAFEAQVKLFPNMLDAYSKKTISQYSNKCCGMKLSGAGGGGYLILVCENPMPESIRVKIRRA
jgi:cytidyltransferase-like protein